MDRVRVEASGSFGVRFVRFLQAGASSALVLCTVRVCAEAPQRPLQSCPTKSDVIGVAPLLLELLLRRYNKQIRHDRDRYKHTHSHHKLYPLWGSKQRKHADSEEAHHSQHRNCPDRFLASLIYKECILALLLLETLEYHPWLESF